MQGKSIKINLLISSQEITTYNIDFVKKLFDVLN